MSTATLRLYRIHIFHPHGCRQSFAIDREDEAPKASIPTLEKELYLPVERVLRSANIVEIALLIIFLFGLGFGLASAGNYGWLFLAAVIFIVQILASRYYVMFLEGKFAHIVWELQKNHPDIITHAYVSTKMMGKNYATEWEIVIQTSASGQVSTIEVEDDHVEEEKVENVNVLNLSPAGDVQLEV